MRSESSSLAMDMFCRNKERRQRQVVMRRRCCWITLDDTWRYCSGSSVIDLKLRTKQMEKTGFCQRGFWNKASASLSSTVPDFGHHRFRRQTAGELIGKQMSFFNSSTTQTLPKGQRATNSQDDSFQEHWWRQGRHCTSERPWKTILRSRKVPLQVPFQRPPNQTYSYQCERKSQVVFV